MKKENLPNFLNDMKYIFDIVRLVDASDTTEYAVKDDGSIVSTPSKCYAVWNKDQRCDNCISAQAFAKRTQLTKFEFIHNDVYYVTSKYIEVDDKPYSLELVNKVTDKTLFGAYGQNSFVKAIESFNQKMFRDSLTGVYNRRFLDEQIYGIRNINAVAMLDLDNFKQINDNFLHEGGDIALKECAKAIKSCIRDSDILVRYGGDEFILFFQNMEESYLENKLQTICDKISSLKISEYPDMKITCSIGGYYSGHYDKKAILKADRAVYDAKQIKNTVAMYKDL